MNTVTIKFILLCYVSYRQTAINNILNMYADKVKT